MKDYAAVAVDLSTMTHDDAVEYALADEAFKKKPQDFFAYVCIDKAILKSVLLDFSIDEAGEAFMFIADYCTNGTEPDYTSMSSTAVKLAVRSIIDAHEKRMNAEFVRHYRQFVATQAKKQAKKQ